MSNEFDWYSRTELLIGKENIEKLKNAHVLVAGLGGVGGFACELLARAGIGTLTLIDSDVYSPSNRNRQIGAFMSTEGMYKTDVMEKRLKDINPQINIHNKKIYLKDENIPEILSSEPYSYVLDAIDTLSPKVFFIYHAVKLNIPLISSMGSGGKFDPSLIRIADIANSHECRLAYIVRKKLHRLGIYSGFKVVFSTEKVSKDRVFLIENVVNKKSVIGTISYMPPLFGAFAASEIIRDILKK